MSNPREALEDAFKVVFGPKPGTIWKDEVLREEWTDEYSAWFERSCRFYSFLDAEAWTDAALMLVDRTRWRILSLHETEVENAPPFEIRLGQRDAGFGRARIVNGTGETEALALAEAALRAKEAGNG